MFTQAGEINLNNWRVLMIATGVICAPLDVGWAAAKPAAIDEELVATVIKGDLKIEIEVPGVFVADDKQEIAIEPKQYKGDLIVTKIAPEGMTVSTGDVLIEFARENLDEALEEAKNLVADAEVESQKAQADLETEKIDADTKLRQLKKELAFAERDYKAAAELEELELQKKVREIEDAKRRIKDAKVDFEQLTQLYEERELHTATENILIERERTGIEEAEKSLARLEEELAHFKEFQKSKDALTKELEVEKKRSELDKQRIKGEAGLQEKQSLVTKAQRKLQLEKAKVGDLESDAESLQIRAPRNGILFYGKTGDESPAGVIFGTRLNSEMRIGGRVQTHEILMTVATMEKLSVRMQVLENDIQHVKPGLEITIRPDAFPAMVLKGELTSVDQVATRTNFLSEVRRFSVKGVYHGNAGQLRSGMNCRVTVHADVIPDAVQVPVVAVSEEKGRYYCYVKIGSRSEKREVRIGVSNDDFVEISEGLRPGEVVYLYDPNRN
jgi:multidrug resistance efflux pump